jgi:TRAP-type C4-dicarboxylate transport system substrate-binding protein
MSRYAAALLVVGLALTGCAGHDKAGHDKAGGTPATGTMTIKVAMRDASPRLISAYADAVARNSEAPTRIEPRTDWRSQEPDSEALTIADVRRGRLDFGLVSARALDKLGVESFAPMLAPFAIDSLEIERRVLASDLADRALATLDRLGVVGVAVLPGDLRHPLGLTRPLVRPEDFDGAFIGVRASALAKRTFEQLGATVEFSAGDDFAAFDGIESDLRSIEGERADEGAASLAPDLSLWPRVQVVVANRQAWERLSAARRAVLREAGHAALPTAIADLRAEDADAHDLLCRRGRVSLARTTAADVDALRRALAPVSRGLNRAAVAEIARLRSAAAEPPLHPPCRPPARAKPGRATPIDGVWSFDSDEADARAAHIAEKDLTPENWGHHVLAFSRGRFAITQEDREACTWVYGTYRVRGHRVTWDVIDGGGHGPENATNRPGEHFDYDWSRFKDTLRLVGVPGAVWAPNFNVKPWRRIGADPRTAPFSRRCPPPPGGLHF